MGVSRDDIDPVERNSFGCRLLAHTKKFQSVGMSMGSAGETSGRSRGATCHRRAVKWQCFTRDFNKQGPYLVMMRWNLMMRWNPGWFSAPHTYATDRICVVVSGTWWVNSGNKSGNKFLPGDAVPVGPGGYVKRNARTPHYDGVLPDGRDPPGIAIFGLGPVDIQLVDPTKPSWRQV